MSVSDAYNYRNIDDNVCTSGVVSAEQLACLGAEGYGAVVNLLPGDSQYAVTEERELVTGQGLEYHFIPVDFSAPTQDNFQQFSKVLDQLGDTRVLIHCAANWRVSAFYSRYAMRNKGWDQARADALVGGLWNPEEHAPWPAFIQQIQE